MNYFSTFSFRQLLERVTDLLGGSSLSLKGVGGSVDTEVWL